MVWLKLIQAMKEDNAPILCFPFSLQGLCRTESSFSCPIRTEGVERKLSMTFSPLISKVEEGKSLKLDSIIVLKG